MSFASNSKIFESTLLELNVKTTLEKIEKNLNTTITNSVTLKYLRRYKFVSEALYTWQTN